MALQSVVDQRGIVWIHLVVLIIQGGRFSYPCENWVVIDVKYLSLVVK